MTEQARPPASPLAAQAPGTTASPAPQQAVSKGAGLAAAVITVLIWTSFIVIGRATAQATLLPLDMSFLRFAGSALVLVPWGWWMVRRQGLQGWLGLSPYRFGLSARVGALAGLGFGTLSYAGFFMAPASHASVLMTGTLPIWATLVAAWLLHERVSGHRAVGLALIVGGGLLVGGASLASAFDGGGTWMGDLCLMAASFSWACYSVQVRRHGMDAIRATIAVAVFTLLCFVPLYALAVATGLVPSRLPSTPWNVILFHGFFQGMLSVVVAGISYTTMVQYFGPVRTTMVTALVPSLSALGAVLFLGEPLGWNLVAGLVLVTVGINFGIRQAAGPAAART